MDSTEKDFQIPQESDILFQNTHISKQKAIDLDVEETVMQARPTPISMIIFYILSAIIQIAIAIFLIVIGFGILVLLYLATILVIAILIGVYMLTTRAIKRAISRNVGNDITFTTYITKTNVYTILNNEKQYTFALADLRKTRTTRNYVILSNNYNENDSVVLSKSGFTKGTYEEFYNFLLSKGIYVKH